MVAISCDSVTVAAVLQSILYYYSWGKNYTCTVPGIEKICSGCSLTFNYWSPIQFWPQQGKDLQQDTLFRWQYNPSRGIVSWQQQPFICKENHYWYRIKIYWFIKSTAQSSRSLWIKQHGSFLTGQHSKLGTASRYEE